MNYSSVATIDDGTCCYVAGCMQETAVNYNPEASPGWTGRASRPSSAAPMRPRPSSARAANTDIALGGPISTSQLGGGGFHFNDNWDSALLRLRADRAEQRGCPG